MAEPGSAAGLLGVLGSMIIAIVIAAVLLFAFWVWMLIDCIQRRFDDDFTKVLWVLGIVVFGTLGAVVYFFAVKRGMSHQHAASPRRAYDNAVSKIKTPIKSVNKRKS